METSKRLYRSSTHKVIGGVAAGLADYFLIDPVLVRVLFVLVAFFGGGGVLIYVVLWIVVPIQASNPNDMYRHASTHYKSAENTGVKSDETFMPIETPRQSNTGLIAGIVLIFVGLLFLIDRLMPWYNITSLWPLILVALGIIIIKPDLFKNSKNQNNEI
ncbi:MAG: PspC domain-containing protein [Bacteroidetes bacterium]|nr:PspC domain-containing protein [Bacteroidota bacterium]